MRGRVRAACVGARTLQRYRSPRAGASGRIRRADRPRETQPLPPDASALTFATIDELLVIPFHPAPDSAELPARFPTPFDRSAVHPLARRAADETIAMLQSPAAAAWGLDATGGGKMFGVLVVKARDGTVGYLRGFSGQLGGQWTIEGWAPPAFDPAARDAIWIAGEVEMLAMTAERDVLARDPAHGPGSPSVTLLDAARRARSRELLPLIQQTYRLANARGDVRTVRELFAPAEPPGGAGDCAAPKLLAQAYRTDMIPIALAEWWLGAPPRTGDRRAGSFYPACHGKCAPILAHMLQGLPADPHPVFGAEPIAADEPRVIFEDEHLLVIDKPSGLLSVPGRSGLLQDSVVTRLRARYPGATGQMVVHRLDLDTSGIMLAAKNLPTFVALQRCFALRDVAKRYVAWLDGTVAGDHGVIHLPLRVDIDDRPRQIHDPVHGKDASTSWEVLERTNGRTRVALTPHTGRTHQLRVHAAHPEGLDAPIVGDRLYGRAAPEDGVRLMLHAERVSFVHPHTGAQLTVERPAPF
ncbi:MAG: RluA family pseudouridine synthase [Gemmatimonadaceae bacterium]|nr:RluA family pseudouridine synthase [Gemmatimonadaceae bacterium]